MHAQTDSHSNHLSPASRKYLTDTLNMLVRWQDEQIHQLGPFLTTRPSPDVPTEEAFHQTVYEFITVAQAIRDRFDEMTHMTAFALLAMAPEPRPSLPEEANKAWDILREKYSHPLPTPLPPGT